MKVVIMVSEFEKLKEERDFWKKEFEKAKDRAEKMKGLDNQFKLALALLEKNPDSKDFILRNDDFNDNFDKSLKEFNQLVSENKEAKKRIKKRDKLC